MDIKYSYICREKNKIADFLANWAISSERSYVWNTLSSPKEIKDWLQADSWGMPNYRFCSLDWYSNAPIGWKINSVGN